MLNTVKNALPSAAKARLRPLYARLRPIYRRVFPVPTLQFHSEEGNLPKTIVLYVNLKCLAVCPHCYLIQDNPEVFHGNKSMSDELFYKLLDAPSNRRVNTLTFAGGEALQHPKVFEWCAEGQRRGKSVQIISNGMSYSYDKIVDRLLQEKPFNNLQISLDATNEKDYVAAKGLKKAPFAKICENIRRVATHYKNDPTVSVVTSFVISNANIGKVAEMIELAQYLNVDVVHLHTLQLGNQEKWKVLGDSLFFFPPEYHALMSRTDYSINIHVQPPLQEQFLRNYCRSLDVHLTVGPDGSLSPCGHRSWSPLHGNFQTTESPHNIPARREMRRMFIAADGAKNPELLHEHCRMCNRRLKGYFRFDRNVKSWEFIPAD